MATDRVCFRVQGVGEDALRERLGALERWYGASVSVAREGGVAIGVLGGEPDGREARWGAASEDEPGTWARLGFAGVRASGVGPHALYEAEGVACTHAVGAALLAFGRAELDRERLPELVAAELVGGGATLLRGVRALPRQPLEPVRERDASASAERGLLAGMAHLKRVRPSLGLTAGADSRVVAVALAELQAEVEAFTWGEPESLRAADLARRLGFEHVTLPFEALDPAHAIASMTAEARWTDGAARLSPFGRQPEPPGGGPLVTGAGGEVGRAFWYRLTARNGAARLRLARRLHGADAAARTAAQDAADAWVAAARAAGFRGAAALDAAYAEQRLPAWGRSVLPRTERELVAAFASREVLRALASLPLEDKLTDGFHRRFIAARRPDLRLPAPRTQRRGVPAPARRAVAAVRRARGGARRDLGPWPLATLWTPQTRAFVDEHVAGWAALDDVFGERWAGTLRTRFAADEPEASLTVLRLAGPALLDRELSR